MIKKPTQLIAYTSILVAFAILIPIIMPLKLIIGPASFTLASHVPLFLAIFMSIPVAILVALGTTLGFLLAGLPLIIVLRALSHLLFAILAAWWLSRKPQLMTSAVKCFSFAFFINVIHGLAEFLVVYILTATTATSMSYFWYMLGLIGLGSLIHGILDFYLALVLWRFLAKNLKLPTINA
ncbi:TPA: hypothetical protein VLM22_001309 [Streptococcus pyogenes]|uniref:hypothetical protein n=1 Tax=Streptococcus pyogenes TaxID=1314 RepID=UPI0010A195B2|nr:hypothetical protein [Streptococcus pyogenes]VHF51647.1 membrane protein [Streptococcus pyogenes]VHM17704.1 membrane protein [Streptococcus pyogenes]HER6149407.1 hypothetical protein [Streptococcus pyogenes]HER6170460.1 hypothetical protein [Streptococcus pyogenes]HER6190744.1 hypothetical protein [Streptococcus pyogenes]